MKTRTGTVEEYHFYFPNSDTHIRVENRGESVRIRATRNSFSEAHKTAFIKRLVAEDFIPAEFQWSGSNSSLLHVYPQPEWLIDASWLTLSKPQRERSHRFMVRLFACSIMLWILLMGTAISRQAGRAPTAVSKQTPGRP
ncbi:MAG TPA: hypothetical protein VMF06_07035 [Candidatus Limnocylindria bacterium]|jgi:hypothetical protein|nr:hypothetical protein [Candidatus Limnocylindria bacterium]